MPVIVNERLSSLNTTLTVPGFRAFGMDPADLNESRTLGPASAETLCESIRIVPAIVIGGSGVRTIPSTSESPTSTGIRADQERSSRLAGVAVRVQEPAGTSRKTNRPSGE